MSIKSVMPSSHLILRRPLLLLPPIPPSIRVFSKESTLRMRWPKYWSFCFSISPSKEHPGLISFRMDWLDLPAVQGTLKSLLFLKKKKNHILFFQTVLLYCCLEPMVLNFHCILDSLTALKIPMYTLYLKPMKSKHLGGGPPSGYFKHLG